MKFLHASLWLLTISPLLCYGLKCYYCQTDYDKVSSCDEGQEVMEQECVPGYPPDWWCRYMVSDHEFGPILIRLGCEQRENSLVEKPCETIIDRGIEFQSCSCQSDLCNYKQANSLLKCWTCSGIDDRCSAGETPTEKECPPNTQMCYRRTTTRLYPEVEESTKMGCTKKYTHSVYENPEASNSYYNIKDASFSIICYRTKLDPYDVYIDACYCTTDLCNINFNQTGIQINWATTRIPAKNNGEISSSLTMVVLFSSLFLYFRYNLFNVM